MEEFVLFFRRDIKTKEAQPSPEQMQAAVKKWQDWTGSVAAQNKLAGTGPRLHPEGKVVRPNDVVTNGPYAEIKEAIGGFMRIKASDYDDAVSIAKMCPILEWGGSVEIRKAIGVDDDAG